MTFPILGGNGAVGGYEIANSLRFNDGDSAYLQRTPSTGNRKTWTWSCWVKRSNVTTRHDFFSAGTASNNTDTMAIRFDTGGNLTLAMYSSDIFQTSRLFRDASAWYHMVLAMDTTQSTSSDRVKLYINGTQVTDFTSISYPSQNADLGINGNVSHNIGRLEFNDSFYLDGYLAEINFIDGQALSPTDFGEFDEDSGIWKPISYTGSYGTNGFYLDFENSGSLGADQSGNGNNWTTNNLASTDQTTDTPTNNFCTLNPLDNYWANSTFSEGNCKMVTAGSGYGYPRSTMGVSSGKWYFEAKASNLSGNLFVGIVSTTGTGTEQEVGNKSNDYGYKFTSGAIRENTVETSYGDSLGTSDILGVGIDLDNNKLYFSKNGTWQNSANPETNTGGFSITAPSSTLLGEYFASASDINSSNSSTVAFNFGNSAFSISSGNNDDNGYGNFEYAPPSGYLALCTQNLATASPPTIDDGSQYFNSILYTGDGNSGGARNITGVGFQPDWTWIKERNSVAYHNLFDSNRGAGYVLHSNASDAEGNYTTYFTSFDSDGFTLENNAGSLNGNGDTYVAWNWKSNAGSTSSNTDGSNTSTVQANQTAGFSIVKYTRDGNSVTTVGHGLGKTPKVLIEKDRDTSGTNWAFITTAIDGTDDYSFLNTTNAFAATTADAFTTTTFRSSMGANQGDIIAYVFADIEGYSKFGSYTGSGTDNDGPMVYTGFKPSFLMVKNASNTGEWGMFDSKRNTFNVVNARLSADSSGAEYSGDSNRDFDFLSNGFKVRNGSADVFNTSGDSFLYMCFAENPFVDSNGVPNTAR